MDCAGQELIENQESREREKEREGGQGRERKEKGRIVASLPAVLNWLYQIADRCMYV